MNLVNLARFVLFQFKKVVNIQKQLLNMSEVDNMINDISILITLTRKFGVTKIVIAAKEAHKRQKKVEEHEQPESKMDRQWR